MTTATCPFCVRWVQIGSFLAIQKQTYRKTDLMRTSERQMDARIRIFGSTKGIECMPEPFDQTPYSNLSHTYMTYLTHIGCGYTHNSCMKTCTYHQTRLPENHFITHKPRPYPYLRRVCHITPISLPSRLIHHYSFLHIP